MADKIQEIAERLVWAGGTPVPEKQRIERILREKLTDLMEQANRVATMRPGMMRSDAIKDLGQLVKAYGWPWRKHRE